MTQARESGNGVVEKTLYMQAMDELEQTETGTGEAAIIHGIRALVLSILAVGEQVNALVNDEVNRGY